MVCSLRSSSSSSGGRSEVVRLDTNALELIPNILFLQDITVSTGGKVHIGIEGKLCPACRSKLDAAESCCKDVAQLYKCLCDACQSILVEYAKTTLSASKTLLRCAENRPTNAEPSSELSAKRLRTISKSVIKPEPPHNTHSIRPEVTETTAAPLETATESPSDACKEPTRHLGGKATNPKGESSLLSDNTSVVVLIEDCKKEFLPERVSPHYGTTEVPNIFEKLLETNKDWCRYCGTTNGVNWRPGPWGRRTLCNRHGCDFKGYGFSAHKPKLNLHQFLEEPLSERIIPVLKEYCMSCLSKSSSISHPLIMCHGCTRSFHPLCHQTELSPVPDECIYREGNPWFCTPECKRNLENSVVVFELPKKMLPFSIAISRNTCVKKKPSSSSSSPSVRKPKSSCNSFLSSYRKVGKSLDSFTYDSELIGKISQCSMESSHIELPKWNHYSTIPDIDETQEENTSDTAFIERHSKFENLERHNKLLFDLLGAKGN